MAGRIPQDFLDSLLARADIVDVIHQFSSVDLKKKGANYTACCPFHEEKTPSFTVTPVKQFYYCFGCGVHGNAISFLRDYQKLDFVEAVEELAQSLGMEVPRESRQTPVSASSRQATVSLYETLDQAARFFQWQLRQPAAQHAVAYLKNRGISGHSARQFMLGYSPNNWDALQQKLGCTPALDQALLDTGLLIQNDAGRRYDRFRDRIMFPIRDRRGRVIAFGGRLLTDNAQPKYLNSPESNVFHKGHELYGLYEVLHAGHTTGKIHTLLVVEGYMDVIALSQHGIHNAVATLGTAVTESQVRLLFKHVQHIICCFDGDSAGRKAAWRALKNALPLMTGTRRMDFLMLDAGDDPDSFVQQHGVEAFNARMAQAVPFGEFWLQRLSSGVDVHTVDGRSLLISRAAPYLQRLPASSLRELLIQTVAMQCKLTPHQATKLLLGVQKNVPLQHTSPEERLTPAQYGIAQLVQSPLLACKVYLPVCHPEDPSEQLLWQLIRFIQKKQPAQTSSLLEQWPDADTGTQLARYAMLKDDLKSNGDSREICDIIAKVIYRSQQKTLEKLFDKSKQETLTPHEKATLRGLLSKKAGNMTTLTSR